MLIQGLFWLENNQTENQSKIAETIYTPLSNRSILTCSSCVLQLLEISVLGK
jgi:hypothetical protein